MKDNYLKTLILIKNSQYKSPHLEVHWMEKWNQKGNQYLGLSDRCREEKCVQKVPQIFSQVQNWSFIQPHFCSSQTGSKCIAFFFNVNCCLQLLLPEIVLIRPVSVLNQQRTMKPILIYLWWQINCGIKNNSLYLLWLKKFEWIQPLEANWCDKMWTNPGAPAARSLKGSPDSVIRLRQVNKHRRLLQSLNVSVAFVSTLMKNY